MTRPSCGQSKGCSRPAVLASARRSLSVNATGSTRRRRSSPHGSLVSDRSSLPNENSIEPILVGAGASLADVLRKQTDATSHGLPAGIVLVVDTDGSLVGVVTDGDVRRAIVRNASFSLTAGEVMTPNPITFPD